MPDDIDATPLIDIPALRRDVYYLVALLFSDESVAKVDALRDLADAHYEAEVNRLLIWVAIAVRQLLDINGDLSRRTCGRLRPDLRDPASEDLTFRDACNKIVHAVEIIPYDLGDNETTIPDRASYNGTITIRGRGRRKGVSTHAVVDFGLFAEYCTLLSEGFLTKD